MYKLGQKDLVGKLNKQIKGFKQWWEDESSEIYHSLTISYNPELKKKIEKENCYDVNNIIIDNMLFSKLLSNILRNYCGKDYLVSDYYKSNQWIPDISDKKNIPNDDLNNISQYLKDNDYMNKTEFWIDDIEKFLEMFIDYPTKYSVTPIIIASAKNRSIIMIHEINTLVVASLDEQFIKILMSEFDKVDITYLKR